MTAGDPVSKDRWPAVLVRDYGADIPNLFRFELAERWRGYYSLVGEPGGARVWVLYLWDHRTYSKQSGYFRRNSRSYVVRDLPESSPATREELFGRTFIAGEAVGRS